jgi:hypothetical protein
MTTNFYGFLWVLFGVSAGILWLGGVFTMMAAVVFGFTAFGLIFTGMMCVLPGMVSHPASLNIQETPLTKAVNTVDERRPVAAKAFTYRSA